MIDLLAAVGATAMVCLLMFGLGLQQDLADLRSLLRRRGILAIVGIVNVAVIPLAAASMVHGLGIEAAAATGILLCAAAPGGPVVALYASLARSDLALAAAGTIGVQLIGLVTTPLILTTVAPSIEDLRLPVLPLVGSLVLFQAMPLLAGAWIHQRHPARAERWVRPTKALGNGIIALLVVLLTTTRGSVLLEVSAGSWFTIASVSALSLALGMCLPGKQLARSGGLLALSRNFAIALMLGTTFYPDPRVQMTVLAYAFVAFVAPLCVALWWGRESHEG